VLQYVAEQREPYECVTARSQRTGVCTMCDLLQLQCVAVCCSVLLEFTKQRTPQECVAAQSQRAGACIACSVLQLQCAAVAVWCSVLHNSANHMNVLQLKVNA